MYYCCYLYFLEINFRFQLKVCDGFFNENHNRYYYKVFLEKCSYNNIIMLFFNRNDISEGINLNKTNELKEYIIC